MESRLIILSSGDKQVVLTPETKQEEDILSVFNEPNIKIHNSVSYSVDKCLGGYYREYESDKSTVILLTKESK